MKRGLLIALSGAALVAGLSGCSSSEEASPSSSSSASSESSSSASSSASESASAGAGGSKVTIDGQDQQIDGQVVCQAMGGNMNIAIGQGGAGIAAVVGEGDAPTVTSVGLGNVNGVTLAMGMGAGDATAVKDGKTYKITGNATGIDMANPMSPVTKPFEIEVTCP
ncbi:MAG: conserved lipoprotein/antigen [Mycobacterium sp.]|nr:conserved lipoprotein/antigen [Mycobacterium sp.]